MSEAFHVLPLAGGLFDQPAGYITRMEIVLRATMDQETVDRNKNDAKARADARARSQAE